VEVFKQASFFEKILPDLALKRSLFNLIIIKQMSFLKAQNRGLRFCLKPVGLELDCLKTGTYLCFLFIYYFFVL